MKLTPWFPPEVPPAHPGVYEVETKYIPGPFYRLWDGRFWRMGGDSPVEANRPRAHVVRNDRRWRGIQKD